jgi:hypothetical protein
MRKSSSLWARSECLCLAVVLIGFLDVTPSVAFAAAPRPDEDGLDYCVFNDAGSPDEPVVGPNKCCYEESANGDDTLTVCIQCDSDWKNCKEVWEDGSSRPRISFPPASGGTLSDPRPRKNSAPVLKLK